MKSVSKKAFSSIFEHFLRTVIKYITQHYVLLLAIWRDDGLSTIRYSCGFVCHKRVLKTFPAKGYLCYGDEVVWIWHFLVNLHVYGSPFYLATAQPHCFIAIERDGGLIILCHCCGFVCQQKVLKIFPGPGYLCSRDEVVWLWDFLINWNKELSK